MKKILLAFSSLVLSSVAFSQSSLYPVINKENLKDVSTKAYRNNIKSIFTDHYSKPIPKSRLAFFTETFGTGSATTMPTGWTTGSSASPATAAVWKWIHDTSTSQFHLAALASSSASNGWMIFDSDLFGAGGVTSQHAWLQSPTINCAAYPIVELSWEENYRMFTDSTWVAVSDNGGSSWTTFPLLVHDLMGTNDGTLNPAKYFLNISSIAGGKPNVKIRFYFKGDVGGPTSGYNGDYSWLLDDVKLSDALTADPQLAEAAFTRGFTYMPLSLVDTLAFGAYVDNYASGSASVTYSTNILKGVAMTSVSTGTAPAKIIPAPSIDSVLNTSNTYLPPAADIYRVAGVIAAANDANTVNNIDTSIFIVTDSVLGCDFNTVAGGYFIARGATSNGLGFNFIIPTGKSDTASSVSVALINGSTASTTLGAKIIAKVYKLDNTTGNPIMPELFTTVAKTIATSDITTSSTIKWVTMKLSGSSSNNVLTEGLYQVLLEPETPGSDTIIVASSPAYNTALSVIDAGLTHLQGSGSTGIFGLGRNAALVRLNFANKAWPLGVDNVSTEPLVNVSPNPASGNVNFSIQLKENAKSVSISLSNSIGQVVKTIEMGSVNANTANNVQLTVADLSKGIYIYTVNIDGQKISNKLMVK